MITLKSITTQSNKLEIACYEFLKRIKNVKRKKRKKLKKNLKLLVLGFEVVSLITTILTGLKVLLGY